MRTCSSLRSVSVDRVAIVPTDRLAVRHAAADPVAEHRLRRAWEADAGAAELRRDRAGAATGPGSSTSRCATTWPSPASQGRGDVHHLVGHLHHARLPRRRHRAGAPAQPRLRACRTGTPCMTAKAVLTLDEVSGGRAILGVGAGHVEGEFELLGVDFAGRGARPRRVDRRRSVPRSLDEYPEYHGELFDIADVGLRPRPVHASRTSHLGRAAPPAGRAPGRRARRRLAAAGPRRRSMRRASSSSSAPRRAPGGDQPVDIGALVEHLYVGAVPDGLDMGPWSRDGRTRAHRRAAASIGRRREPPDPDAVPAADRSTSSSTRSSRSAPTSLAAAPTRPEPEPNVTMTRYGGGEHVLLEGKVAIVSGLGPGMGRDISLALAEQGADIVMGARPENRMAGAPTEVEALGRRALPCPRHHRPRRTASRIAAAAEDELGRLDILVNNAFHRRRRTTFDGRRPRRVARRRSTSTSSARLHLTKAAMPATEGAGGRPHRDDQHDVGPATSRPRYGAYAASKAALGDGHQDARPRAGPQYGIRVNGDPPRLHLGPVGGVVLRLARRAAGHHRGGGVRRDRVRRRASGTCPTRARSPGTVVYLASDLSKPVTGQSINVNCGHWIQ